MARRGGSYWQGEIEPLPGSQTSSEGIISCTVGWSDYCVASRYLLLAQLSKFIHAKHKVCDLNHIQQLLICLDQWLNCMQLAHASLTPYLHSPI